MNIKTTTYHGSKHLLDQELQPVIQACPWCGFAARQQIALLQRDPLVTLLECPKCFAVGASRMPTEEAMANYYASYYTDKEFDSMQPKVTVGDSKRMGLHLALLMNNRDQKKVLRILDFGGGDGAVAAQAADIFLRQQPLVQRIEITVVDYNIDLAYTPNQAITLQHCSSLDGLSTASFDFVIASAVLEHIPEAKIIFDQLLDLMCLGAVLYARTPFMVPLLKICSSVGVKVDFTFPGHVYDLGQAFWENQFTQPNRVNNFRILSSRPSIVESSFKTHFLRTLMSHTCKFPWLVFGKRWGLVGGWEVAVERIN